MAFFIDLNVTKLVLIVHEWPFLTTTLRQRPLKTISNEVKELIFSTVVAHSLVFKLCYRHGDSTY